MQGVLFDAKELENFSKDDPLEPKEDYTDSREAMRDFLMAQRQWKRKFGAATPWALTYLTMVLLSETCHYMRLLLPPLRLLFAKKTPRPNKTEAMERVSARGYAPHPNPPIQTKNARSGKTLVIEHSKNPKVLSLK